MTAGKSTFGKMGIRFKVLILTLTILIGTISLSCFVIVLKEQAQLKESLLDKADSLGNYLARVSIEPLLTEDELQLDSIVMEVNKNDELVYTYIQNVQGHVMTTWFASFNYWHFPNIEKFFPSGKTDDISEGVAILYKAGEIIQLSFPIAVDNTVLGQVIMGISLNKVKSQISSMIYFMFAVNLCSVLIVFFLLSRSLRTITAPVIDLANLVQRVSKDKDYALCATIKRNDELGYLADGLNEMLSQINQRDKELNAILNNIPDIAWLKDRESRFIAVNEPFARACGWEIERLIGKTDLDIWPKELAERYRSDDREVIMTAKRKQVEEPLVDKDGKKTWIETIKTPIYNNKGEIIGTTGIARDITERKLLEEQFLQAQKMEAIGRLAGGVAHDFNNLLTVIKGYSDLLLIKLDSNEPLHGYADQILNAAVQAADLTRQLLAFTRRQVMELQVVNLNTLIKDMEKLLCRLIGEDIELKTALDPALSPVKVDPGYLNQVIMNLAVNARDAMPKCGMLSLETSNVTLDETYATTHLNVKPGRFAMLAVSDTGMGMDDETKAHIFEPFFTTKEKDKGTGLGLSMVYGIVEQFGGYIWVYSEKGNGTSFKIYLPAIEETPSDIKKRDLCDHIQCGTETVLLVEDNPMVRHFVREVLLTHGYSIIDAGSGEEALSIVSKTGCAASLLITDVILPKMTGCDLADQLTQLYPGVKVLYMSGYTDSVIVNHGVLDAGMKFIQKPFTPAALLNKVREVLE